MKKLFLGCMVALSLASCSDDVVVSEPNDGTKINFAVTAANGNSRATDVFCNNNKPASFTVYGAYLADGATSAVDFMNDVITGSGNTWTNSVNRYWPATGSLDFYAYANGTFDSSSKSFDFTVDPVVANQKDLIYAVNKGQTKVATGTQPAVDLNFRHALSQVVFKAVNKGQKIHVVVNGIGVHNLQNQGTYSLAGITDNTLANIEDHTGNGTDLTNRGEWSNLGTSLNSYEVTGLDVVLTDNDETAVKNLTDGNDVAGDAATRAFTNAMLLIPQSHKALLIAGGNDSDPSAVEENGTYFTVDCTIYNIAGDTYSESDAPLYSGKIRIPATIDWKQGYKYIYTFVFGDGNGGWDPQDPKPVLVPITFQVTVDDFINYTGSDLSVDMETK